MYRIFHNVLNETVFEIEYQRLRDGDWKFIGRSTNQPDEICFWYHDLRHDVFYTQSVFSLIKQLTGENYKLEHVYANGQTYGLCGDIHKDSSAPNSRTFLLYMNPRWDSTWGGATVLSGEETVSILPKPNTAILFNGDTPHVGLEPTRHCKELRITVAFKMTLEKE